MAEGHFENMNYQKTNKLGDKCFVCNRLAKYAALVDIDANDEWGRSLHQICPVCKKHKENYE